jgi:2-keto-3-deoxy-L-rhamnonate aldolase RhmA
LQVPVPILPPRGAAAAAAAAAAVRFALQSAAAETPSSAANAVFALASDKTKRKVEPLAAYAALVGVDGVVNENRRTCFVFVNQISVLRRVRK